MEWNTSLLRFYISLCQLSHPSRASLGPPGSFPHKNGFLDPSLHLWLGLPRRASIVPPILLLLQVPTTISLLIGSLLVLTSPFFSLPGQLITSFVLLSWSEIMSIHLPNQMSPAENLSSGNLPVLPCLSSDLAQFRSCKVRLVNTSSRNKWKT